MPDPSEFKILRDEMAKIIADSKKKDRICSDLGLIIYKQGLEISELKLIILEHQKRLTYYENPHSPPSSNSLQWREARQNRNNETIKTWRRPWIQRCNTDIPLTKRKASHYQNAMTQTLLKLKQKNAS